MALPSGYEYADVVYRNTSESSTPYFDLGVYPTSAMKFSILAYVTSEKNWVFGSRNSNSNSSAGQLNYYVGTSSAADYLGYAGARISMGTKPFTYVGGVSMVKDGYEFVFNNANKVVVEKTGATTTFTGTQTMYLFAVNSGGTVLQGSASYNDAVYGVRIESGSSLTHNFIPVYDETNNEQCLYDTVTDTIVTKSGSGDWHDYSGYNTHYALTIDMSEGGSAYAETEYGQRATKLYCRYANNNDAVEFHDSYIVTYTKLCAVPDNGYSFSGWEYNGSIVSEESVVYVEVSDAATVKAVFVKNADVKKNNCLLMGLAYGSTYSTATSGKYVFAEVLSASLNVDGVSKATSTIVCKEIPSTLLVNTIVFLKNPKGKILYTGVVNSINGNTITCREPLSLFDSDFLFQETSSSTNTLMNEIALYMYDYILGYPSDDTSSGMNYAVQRKMSTSNAMCNRQVSIINAENMNITQPVISSAEISNLEDYIIDKFDQFGIYVDARPYWDTLNSLDFLTVMFEVINPKLKQAITIGNNSESISNVDIDVQEMENTIIQIYDSSGSTLRGIYCVKTDGTIVEFLWSLFQTYICYNSCKLKVIMSDEKLNVLLEQYLSNAKYNHKITFDLSLDNSLYSLDDFTIGRRVDFYYDDKLYSSIVTGTSFDLSERQENPSKAKITLGKVRNKLTIKLNKKNRK